MPQNDKELILCQKFQGLDRLNAPHLLDEGHSPDTSDAGQASEINALLGARLGRKRISNYNNNPLSVIPCNLPDGKFRVVCDNSGTWTAYGVPWPAPTAPPGGLSGTFTTASLSCSGGTTTTVTKTVTVTNGGITSVV